jgi:hypothetical protein
MGEDYYNAENSYTLQDGVWSKTGDETYLFSDETAIYDYVFDKAAISPEKFAESRYKPYKYLWPNYGTANAGKDYHEEDEYHNDYEKNRGSSKYHEHILTYTVSDGADNAQGIYLFKKDKESYNPEEPVFTERMTAGVLNSVDAANDLITLTEAREYSAAYGEWRPVMANVPISTEKAFVLKDGKKIDLSELNPNDNLYIISQDGFALLILVEQ